MPLLLFMLIVIGVQASPLNVRSLGAAGDGITDDAGSIQLAIDRVNTEGGCVYIPAGKYRLGRPVTVKVAALRGLCITGEGPTSVLLATGSGAGLEITGTAGLSYELVYLSGFKIKSAPGSGLSAGLHVIGVAGFGITNLQIDGSEGVMQYGLLLSGGQQGYIKGGLNYRAVVGIGLEDSSNGVEISGVSFDDLDAALEVTRVDDGFFHANHVTSSRYGVHIVSTGSGAYVIQSNHFELHAGGSIYQEAGITFVRNNSFYNKQTELDIVGGKSLISENLINGSVSFGTGISRSVFRDNICFGPLLDRSHGGVAFSGESGKP
ncbi:MAG: glycoside hydrolase family 55 protein [Acidobacteriota bacterium]|nr:glycoside hydrolase family 55 protein [Acidobacteriota bacterium]